MNAPAAARTYRIGGVQPYLMLLVLAACAVFAPLVLAHAVSNRSWWELGWAAVVIWWFFGAAWRAAYRIDVRSGMVEFRSLLWRRSAGGRCTCTASWTGGTTSSVMCGAQNARVRVFRSRA